MLDLFSTDQEDIWSPRSGTLAPQVAPSAGQAFSAAWEATRRLDGADAQFHNQRDFMQERASAFTARTGIELPKEEIDEAGTYDSSYGDWLRQTHTWMTAESHARNDTSLLPPDDSTIAAGGIEKARAAQRRAAVLASGPTNLPAIGGRAAAGAVGAAIDPCNAISLAAASEGGALLVSALRMGGAMAGRPSSATYPVSATGALSTRFTGWVIRRGRSLRRRRRFSGRAMLLAAKGCAARSAQQRAVRSAAVLSAP